MSLTNNTDVNNTEVFSSNHNLIFIKNSELIVDLKIFSSLVVYDSDIEEFSQR